MSAIEEDSQTTRSTIRERIKFVLNNLRFSDGKFVVRKIDGDSESKQVIPAHKFVLSISSTVFEAMFYGELAETRDSISIELPDCEYESLLELFRYMYSDEVNLSGSNVLGVLYLAKKYMVPLLAVECTQYLQANLDPSNVLSIFSSAQKYDDKDLMDACWQVIEEQPEKVFKSDKFTSIERFLLKALVIKDTLAIEEIEMFKAVDLWATKECERQGEAVNGAAKRRILGEEIINEIRFPTMKQEDFASAVLDSDLLTKEEIVRIVKYFNSVSTSAVGFPETKRRVFSGHNILRCCRFGSLSDQRWTYTRSKDAINFSVDKDVALLGLCFFGREKNSYSAELEVVDAKRKTVLTSKTETGCLSKLLQGEKSTYYGFEVLFENKIPLNKSTSYGIRALISGSPLLRGVNCVGSIQCSCVTFTFSDSVFSSNGTDVKQGQFAELLFCL